MLASIILKTIIFKIKRINILVNFYLHLQESVIIQFEYTTHINIYSYTDIFSDSTVIGIMKLVIQSCFSFRNMYFCLHQSALCQGQIHSYTLRTLTYCFKKKVYLNNLMYSFTTSGYTLSWVHNHVSILFYETFLWEHSPNHPVLYREARRNLDAL